MLAVIYGIIPNAKMAALLNAPPVKALINPNISLAPLPEAAASKAVGLTPGNTMNEPSL